MYLVKANNILSNKKYKAEFESEAEANEWLQRQINKNSFGKPARQAIKDQDQYDPSLVLSEFQDNDGRGNVRTIVSLKAEYEYEGPTLIDGSGVSKEDKNFRMDKARAKVAVYKKFKAFGEEVELFFTALINERNFTQEQKDALQSNAEVNAVLAELKYGRIAKSKGMVEALTADESLLYQDDLDAVISFMEDFLSELV